MTQDELKKVASLAAIKYIKSGMIIGIGTGSTIGYFIKELESIGHIIKGVVSSSKVSSDKLRNLGIKLFDLNDVDYLDIYIDSADEINSNMQMIKGGGAALTYEKVIAAASHKFICIADDSKLVKILGNFPLPIEVIPMARSWVARELIHLGGQPIYRQGVITDIGNVILDIHNLKILDAVILEEKINNIPGVVTVGLFAHRTADLALISSSDGLKIIK